MAATTGIAWTNGDKKLARQKLNIEVRAGRIAHPNSLPCADCGHVWNTGDPRHEYDHYKGYAPKHHLIVEPVCSLCHKQRDSQKARQTHCVNGHEFTPENTGIRSRGRGRFCYECRRIFDREKRVRPEGFWQRINANRKHLNYGKGV